MKAVCVTENRELEVRDVPTPTDAPSDHVLVNIAACAINHGDKTFLAHPGFTAGLNTSLHNIWGASASGRVLSAGSAVPTDLIGRNVAIYRSLTRSPHTVGLWCERAVVPYTSCVILTDGVAAQDYSGSLVNAISAYAFLEEMTAERHKGVVVTAGNSATGLAMAALTQEKKIPAIFLVRSAKSRETLRALNIEHVLASTDDEFETQFERLAEQLKTTAVFDGVGGELVSRIAPHLPVNAAISFYGLLAGSAPVSIPSALFMTKNLIMKRFSNFNSATVRDTTRLRESLDSLTERMSNPLFRTRIGKTFSLDQIHEAMANETTPCAKAILLTRPV
jgi:NADPH:quinone reductase-like Zn-dependent oxidoreductase